MVEHYPGVDKAIETSEAVEKTVFCDQLEKTDFKQLITVSAPLLSNIKTVINLRLQDGRRFLGVAFIHELQPGHFVFEPRSLRQISYGSNIIIGCAERKRHVGSFAQLVEAEVGFWTWCLSFFAS